MKSVLKLFIIFTIIVNISQAKGKNAVSIKNPLSTAIDALFDRAKGLLDKATDDGLILESNAGAQALNLMVTAKESYKDALSSSSHVISGQEQQFLSGMKGFLDEIQLHIVNHISTKITQIALMLPLTNKTPQLTEWTGNVIGPHQAIILTLNGLFRDASNTGYEPKLKIGSKIYQTSQKGTQNIVFQIPGNDLQHLDNKISYISATVIVPYYKNLFQRKQEREFQIQLILLPKSAGTFKFIQSIHETQKLSQRDICQGLVWSGHEENVKGCPVRPGWLIDMATVTHTMITERGKGFGHDHWDEGLQMTPTFVGLRIKSDGDDSFLEYKIEYNIYKDNPVDFDDPNSKDEVIEWGNSKVYTVVDAQSTWKAVYKEFDGKTVGFATSSEDNPYVRINQTANQVTVSFAPFE